MGVLGVEEARGITRLLLHQEERQSAVGLGAVGIAAREQHQDVGPRGERTPGLGAVEQPSARGLGGGRADRSDVAAEVRLGDGDREPRQPALLLGLRATAQQGARHDLGPRDERASDAEPPPGKLLGRDDHAQVLRLATVGEAPELFGHREAEAAELVESLDDGFGDVAVGAVHVLGVGANLLQREAMEEVSHRLEVLIEVARAGRLGQRREEGRIAVRRHEGGEGREPLAGEPPELFTP